MVVDANKDIKDMTELFYVISRNITKEANKENTPEEPVENLRNKRPNEKNSSFETDSKRQSILRDSSF